jgi:hypothetical protein
MNEFVEKLKSFSSSINGEFHHGKQSTTSLKRMGWSRVEIRVPDPAKEIHFIAFSGTNSAEVYSGFYAEGKLPANLFCRISEQDAFTKLMSTFSSYKMKSGKPEFDKRLHTACNNKSFLLKLTGNHETSSFLTKAIRRPLRFEVMTNEKGILKGKKASAMVISLNTNEWIVDHDKLVYLLDGFRQIIRHIG